MLISTAQNIADLRTEPRFQVPGLRARLDGREVELIDISLHGLRVRTEQAFTPLINAEAAVELLIPLLDFVCVFHAPVSVVWSGSRDVGLSFSAPSDTWRFILSDLEARAGTRRR